jgi:hypothetical protein
MYMVALYALITGLTISLVMVAARLTFELDALDRE